ncbi:MAG TPA: hypothetical protein VK612_09305, partial [Pyrinomonadaceae bacterium]|nr:hypothetical protein [Pyrinomonadaceae bacterium]
MRKQIIFAALVGLFAIACNTTGTPVEFAKACDIENEKKTIEVSGFLDDKGSLFCSNIGGGNVKCGFRLMENKGDEKTIGADIEQGSSANNVEKLGSGYKKEDIKVRDNGGNIINMADKVKLTG